MLLNSSAGVEYKQDGALGVMMSQGLGGHSIPAASEGEVGSFQTRNLGLAWATQ